MLQPRSSRQTAHAQLVAAAVFAALCLSPAPSAGLGEPTAKEKAQAKVAEGAKLFEQGKFSAALQHYEAARAIFESPKIDYNMGLAYLGMGKHALAFLHLDRFVREDRDAKPEYLAAARAELKRLARKIGFVTVSCDIDGSEVWIDGHAIGSTPFKGGLPVDAGRRELLVRSKSWGTRTTSFNAVAGRSLGLRVDFQTEPAKGSAKVAGSRPQALLTPSPSSSPRSEASAPSSGASQAEALIREATELRRAGKDARAYPLFQKAYDVETTPRTGAQLGLVEMQLGYWLLAEKHLTESLASARDPWIAGNRADLEASLAKAKAAIGEILVTGSPLGATVLVNGKAAGSLPSALARVGEGPANIEVRAPGHSSAFRSMIVVGGRREEVAFTLDRVSSATGSGEPGSGAAAIRGSQLNALDREESSTGKRGLGTLSRPLAWTSAGLAATAAGFGVYQTALWRKKFAEFESYRAPAVMGASTTCGVDEKNHGPAGCDAIYSDFKRAQNLAVVGLVAGGLLAAGAVVLFLLSPADERSALACTPALSGSICSFGF